MVEEDKKLENIPIGFLGNLKELQIKKNDFVYRTLSGKITLEEIECLAQRIELRLLAQRIELRLIENKS